jgi:hypothetical protein
MTRTYGADDDVLCPINRQMFRKLRFQMIDDNAEAVYKCLAGTGRDKGEFETTAAYQERLERAKSAPIIGRLDVNSLFGFQVIAKHREYDADNQIMTIVLNPGTFRTGKYFSGYEKDRIVCAK